MARYSKLLFVCEDNSNLSPMAESLFVNMYRGDPVYVSSRGLVVLFPVPINPKTEVVLAKHGIDLVRRITADLRAEDLDEETLVVVMSADQRRRFLERFPGNDVVVLTELAGEEKEIKDPYGGTLMDYETCFVEMSRIVKKIAYRMQAE